MKLIFFLTSLQRFYRTKAQGLGKKREKAGRELCESENWQHDVRLFSSNPEGQTKLSTWRSPLSAGSWLTCVKWIFVLSHGSSEWRAIQKQLTVPEHSTVCMRHLCVPFFTSSDLSVRFSIEPNSRTMAMFRNGYSSLDPALLALGYVKQLNNLQIAVTKLFSYSFFLTSHPTSLIYSHYCSLLQQEVRHPGTQLLSLLAGTESAASPSSLNVFIDCPSLWWSTAGSLC